ncbi:MAG: hypothetical protein SCK70_15530, partial [bacterium]|nr:hypothetical protein [bacterium]
KEIRIIYERILTSCSTKIPNMKEFCSTNYEKPILGKQTIDWLSKNKHINSIHRNFFFGLKMITSDFGAHEDIEKEKIYKPTLDTVKSLVFALKDSILWLDAICKKNE